MKPIVPGLAALLLAATAPPMAQAHHGTAQQFDLAKTVMLKGVVSRVDWRNPHIYFMVDVKDADGKVAQWWIETVPVAFARKAGITKEMMMDGGREVQVAIAPARKEEHLGWARRLILSDGRTIQLSGG